MLRPLRQPLLAIQREQRRNQLAAGQIARGAENDDRVWHPSTCDNVTISCCLPTNFPAAVPICRRCLCRWPADCGEPRRPAMPTSAAPSIRCTWAEFRRPATFSSSSNFFALSVGLCSSESTIASPAMPNTWYSFRRRADWRTIQTTSWLWRGFRNRLAPADTAKPVPSWPAGYIFCRWGNSSPPLATRLRWAGCGRNRIALRRVDWRGTTSGGTSSRYGSRSAQAAPAPTSRAAIIAAAVRQIQRRSARISDCVFISSCSRCVACAIRSGERRQFHGVELVHFGGPLQIDPFDLQRTQFLQQFARVLVALRRIFGQHFVDDAAQSRRQIGPRIFQSLGLRAHVLQGHAQGRFAAEGRLAAEHVVAGDAQAVDVAARIERLALDLLGAHVQRRAHRDADLRELGGIVRRRPTRARPKSATFTSPLRASMMFSGLMSRWTMPRSAALHKAAVTCRMIATAILHVRASLAAQ